MLRTDCKSWWSIWVQKHVTCCLQTQLTITAKCIPIRTIIHSWNSELYSLPLEPWDRFMWADVVRHIWTQLALSLTALSSSRVRKLEPWRRSSRHTAVGNYTSLQLRYLLQIASASSEPSAHSGSPSQRHRAGTHWPFLQVKSVVAHVFFAVKGNITLATPQQEDSVHFQPFNTLQV